MNLKCIRCPKGKKKDAKFIYFGGSYCKDCYYIRLEEVEELAKQHKENMRRLEKDFKR